MHFHHYSLIHLSEAINQQYAGQRIRECFTQNKDELVVELGTGFLRIGCHTPLTFLVPVKEYAKARRNVVELFKEIYGYKLLNSRVVSQERTMILELEKETELILKLHGPSSNIMLRVEGEIRSLFKQQRTQDFDFQEEGIEINEAGFEAEPPLDETSVLHALKQIGPVFERKFARAVMAEMEKGQGFPEASRAVMDQTRSDIFYVLREANRVRFYLFPPSGEDAVAVEGIIPALNLYLRTYFQYENYRKMYSTTDKAISKPYRKLEKLYQSYQKNIQTLETDRNPEEIGHILMANLHAIPARSKSVELDDFYTEGTITIKLDPRLNPQENAQRYYAKYKRRKGKLQYLKSELSEIEDRILEGEEQMEEFERATPPEKLILDERGFAPQQMQVLRKLHKSLQKSGETSGQKRYPYRTFQFEGYDIFVGKGAANNDQLSFKFANKEDLWLHAKDVTGSHVIIRKKPGSPFPPSVLEYAASLAAFYSKRKTDTLVAVQYTPRKYIRKRKGDPPGLVAVDREEVIMVVPGK